MKHQEEAAFNLELFLANPGRGRTISEYHRHEIILRQGEPAEALLYILHGWVKLGVVSGEGKEAVVGILAAGSFTGEECLTTQARRKATASALTDCRILRIEKLTISQQLHAQPALSEMLVSCLAASKLRLQENVADLLFHPCERRLARVLVSLAHADEETKLENLPRLTQETLAEMVGTTRGRVNHFMNKFRKLGHVEYKHNGALEVNDSLRGLTGDTQE